MYEYEQEHMFSKFNFVFLSAALRDRVQEGQVETVESIFAFFRRTVGMARIIYCTE